MRSRSLLTPLVAAALAAACTSSSSPPPPTTTIPPGPGAFTFAVWGDAPYSQADATALPRLIDEINQARPAFTVHIGDIAGGPCDDALFTSTVETFNRFTAPLVYVPGDNEWTDCHNAGFDPLERLAHLRRTMFPSSASFGGSPIQLTQQRPDHPENSRWQQGSVTFIGLHVTGSNNNHVAGEAGLRGEAAGTRGTAALEAAEAEFQARQEATLAWLEQGFEAAAAANADGVVIAMQADPRFEIPAAARGPEGVDGFDRLLDAFAAKATSFAKPVVIVHGDSHQYRFDRPLLDPATGRPLPNVSRVETYGSPQVGWVRVHIDPTAERFVRATPEFVAGPRR